MDRIIAFLIAILVALHIIDRKGGIGTPIRRYKFHKAKGKYKPINDTFVDLREKRLSDISNLSERYNAEDVQELILSSNKITDISPLSEFRNLKRLYLNKNQIVDISPLAKLKNLEQLFLSNNKISDISSLNDFDKLERLDLNDNEITDISPLSQLTCLQILKLKGNTINDEQIKELKSVLRKCQIY
ncbi:MAG: leucine-rich repeat protein [Oscillospiraceae bacterium]|nr:leucine-rich repeat protein [Oscillospiraceae bacterium]